MTENNVVEYRGPDEPQLREAPHNAEVEAALLGAILANNRTYGRVADFLAPEHFHVSVHRKIFAVLADHINNGHPANPLAIRHIFDGDPLMEEVGGSRYLYELATNTVSITNVREYGQILLGLWRDRETDIICAEVRDEIRTDAYETPASARIEAMIERLSALMDTDIGNTGARMFHDVAMDALVEIDRTRAGDIDPGIVTGLTDLDKILNSLMGGELIILGGRPGMGKSALALNIAFNVARRNIPVYFVSLEMKDRQVAGRRMAAGSGIATENLRGWRAKQMEQRDFERLQQVVRESDGLPLWLDDRPGLNLPMLKRQAMTVDRKSRAKRDAAGNDGRGLGLIVVDYLQLMRASMDAVRKNNMVAEVSETSRGLKELALSMNVPILALSQLSRQVESRNDKRPLLSDLRDSGSIEQDADSVLFAYREEYYLERERAGVPAGDFEKFNAFEARMEGVRGLAEIIVAKQRDGRTGTATLAWDGAHQQFSDLASERDMYGGFV